MKQKYYFSIILFYFLVLTNNIQLYAQWIELGGINGLAANNWIQSVCSDPQNNIFAAGKFSNGPNNFYVAKWNSLTNSWSALGGAMSLGAHNYIQSICSDASGNIYAGGYFTNTIGNSYVAKWDITTNSWSELGGVNSLQANYGNINTICSSPSGNIYVAGNFTNSNIALGYRYVAEWDKTLNNWSELGGLNSLSPNGEILSICSDISGNIYAAGLFRNTSNYYYVAKWNIITNAWSELGGVNSLAANNSIKSITSDHDGNIYAAGNFVNSSSNSYVAKWNKATNTWSELGGNNSLTTPYVIRSICSDTLGNIYAGGDLFISSLRYIAKWNKITNSWSELGGTSSLAANSTIISICSDSSGNIYAGGSFTNPNVNFYVAKCNQSLATTYTFIGNGNWSVLSNWLGNLPPPVTLPIGAEIIVNPILGGECNLDIPFTMPVGTKLTITTNSKFNINGNLIIY